MNLELNYEGFEKYHVSTFTHGMPDEIHYLFKFDNGYGASVIKIKDDSYGNDDDLWELAIIRWRGDWDPGKFDIVYMNEITGNEDDYWDVYRYLTDEEVRDLLKKIKELKRP